MLDSAEGSSLKPVSLLDPQTIASASTVVSGSGYWVDTTQFTGYILYLMSLGTVTETSVLATLESSAAASGSSPATSSNTLPASGTAVLAAGTPLQVYSLLPVTAFTNRYVGVSVTTVGAGATPISVVAIGGLRSP